MMSDQSFEKVGKNGFYCFALTWDKISLDKSRKVFSIIAFLHETENCRCGGTLLLSAQRGDLIRVVFGSRTVSNLFFSIQLLRFPIHRL